MILMKYLAHLNFSKEKESIEAFNQIESLLFKTQPRLTQEFIRKFMRDNAEMKGLFEVIFQREEGDPHFICCYSLKLLLRLLDRSQLKQSDIFLKLFVGLPASKLINGYKLGSHLEAKGLPKCKTYAYELLKIYRVNNLNNLNNQFHLTTIFSFKKEMENYSAWEKRQIISSITSEGYCLTRGAALASSHKKEEEQIAQIVSEPVYRSRSMTVFQLSPTLRLQNKDDKLWQLSQVELTEFCAFIAAQEKQLLAGKGREKCKYSSEDEENQPEIEIIGDTLNYTLASEGRAFVKVKFPVENRLKLKFFRMKDLVKTALELNKKTPAQRNKKEFYLNFPLEDGSEVSLELHYQELCNMKTKIIYLVGSYFDIAKNIVTTHSDRFDDSSVELCFLSRIELELKESRIVSSASIMLQARDTASARILCDRENLKQAVTSSIQLFSLLQESDDVAN